MIFNKSYIIVYFRIPLCNALGLKVTATVFTAASSQAVAEKVKIPIITNYFSTIEFLRFILLFLFF